MRTAFRVIALASALFALCPGACSAPEPSEDLLTPQEEQTRMRAYQSRSFEVADRTTAMRAVLSVLQDLGFIIERANEPLGLVSAARFDERSFGSLVAITVTVRAESESRMLVRANAIYDQRPIRDPEIYQQFFAALQRSLFLTEH
ncbi:MAG: hypothetical protein IPM29_17450 [Planctomycetes bacterium]|nr:hypothetical protein [Planctomycetota bacterium]